MSSNPPAIPADTTPEAWRLQMDAVARRSVEERLTEWGALNRAGAKMEADGVRRQHPEFTEREVFLTLVRRRYGDDLAVKIWPDLGLVMNREASP